MADSASGGASDFNTKIIEEFRADQGRVGGSWADTTLIIIHHIGARSGTERVTPLGYLAASGSQVVAAFAGRSGPDLAMFALAEGAAAIALVAVMTAVARATRRAGQSRTGLAAAFGIAVAAVS